MGFAGFTHCQKPSAKSAPPISAVLVSPYPSGCYMEHTNLHIYSRCASCFQDFFVSSLSFLQDFVQFSPGLILEYLLISTRHGCQYSIVGHQTHCQYAKTTMSRGDDLRNGRHANNIGAHHSKHPTLGSCFVTIHRQVILSQAGSSVSLTWDLQRKHTRLRVASGWFEG